MDIKWTKEQQKVIDTRNRNILVSAAAGSGKTAVLVERIINMVLSKENPVDIDRLLIVTFTDAAASEMRQRIGEAIEKRLILEPGNEHLKKQSALLYKAQISTIHSFCLNVIRNNFNDINLDPAFRIADDTELKLLRMDILEELFEEKYADNDKEFIRLTDYFKNGVNDDILKDYIQKLENFSQGHPWPLMWLDSCLKYYFIETVEDFNNTAQVRSLVEYAHNMLKDGADKALSAKDICESDQGPVEYLDNTTADVQVFTDIMAINDYDSLRNAICEAQFTTLSRKKDPNTDPEIKELVKKIREEYKGLLKKGNAASLGNYFERSSLEELAIIKEERSIVEPLINITKEFLNRFKEEKLKRNILSFSDMEHYALDILGKPDENGGVIPTQAALEYRDMFAEIMMDEYQDCNRIQEYLMLCISGESIGKYNRFMVGDIKQSIYKFRMASPEMFQEKYDSYEIDDCNGQHDFACERINLHNNFRSRKNVINTVNNLFSQIMHRSLGQVEYDEEAKLEFAAPYEENTDEKLLKAGFSDTALVDDLNTEMLLLVNDKDSEYSKGEQEARMIANKIRDVIKYTPVTDKKTGLPRKAAYKDIVILLRSMTDVATGLKSVLNEEGIPAVLNLKSGFYSTSEIQQVIQFLKILDNPRQDIPLYGTLISFFGGFSDEEIAEIKNSANRYLFDSLVECRGNNSKVDEFLCLYEDFRKRSIYTPIHALLRELITETHYIDYVTTLNGGNQRRANLMMLLHKALCYEETSYKGLFHFVRYLKELQKVESDEGEADVIGDNLDAVRIMTIHKSKGLEFPICFLSGVHKQFNTKDFEGNLVVDMDFGVALDYIDVNRRIIKTPLFKRITARKMRQDLLGEELRVLYVALTRAKEKLIITGVIPQLEKYIGKMDLYERFYPKDEPLAYVDLAGAICYYDWMMQIAKNAQIVTDEDITTSELEEAFERIGLKESLIQGSSVIEGTKWEAFEQISTQFGTVYPHPELQGLIQKTSVSELKKASLDYESTQHLYEETDDNEIKADAGKSAYVPKFMKKETDDASFSGTDRGTAYHKVMELLDFNDKDIKSQFNKMIKEHLISEGAAQSVSKDKIGTFMTSELSARMAKADAIGNLKREQPFVLGIKASRIKPEVSDDEIMLLQGIIDAFFIEDGEVVLLDYKTDRIEKPEELVNRYKIQLDYYEEAITRITGLKVKEKILYSFCLGEEIKC